MLLTHQIHSGLNVSFFFLEHILAQAATAVVLIALNRYNLLSLVRRKRQKGLIKKLSQELPMTLRKIFLKMYAYASRSCVMIDAISLVKNK